MSEILREDEDTADQPWVASDESMRVGPTNTADYDQPFVSSDESMIVGVEDAADFDQPLSNESVRIEQAD